MQDVIGVFNNQLFQAILSGVVGAIVGALCTVLIAIGQTHSTKRQKQISLLQDLTHQISAIISTFGSSHPLSDSAMDTLESAFSGAAKQLDLSITDQRLLDKVKIMKILVHNYLDALRLYNVGAISQNKINELRMTTETEVRSIITGAKRRT